MQTELLDRGDWRARVQLRTAIFHFIEVFYNRLRLHSSLGYQSPTEFARRYAQQQAVASRPPTRNSPRRGANSRFEREANLNRLAIDGTVPGATTLFVFKLRRR